MCNSCNKCKLGKPSDTKVCNISASQVMDPLKYSLQIPRTFLVLQASYEVFLKVYSVTMTRCLNEIGSCCDWPFPIFFKLFPPFKPLQLLDCDKIVRSSSASNSYVRFVILCYATAFWSLEILHPKCKHLHDDVFGIWKDVFDIGAGI